MGFESDADLKRAPSPQPSPPMGEREPQMARFAATAQEFCGPEKHSQKQKRMAFGAILALSE